MPPHVEIAHRSPGRLRIRVHERGDRRVFDQLRAGLDDCPGVEQLDVNPMTGSILIHHDADADAIVHYALTHELFAIAAPRSERYSSPSGAARYAMRAIDVQLRQRTEGRWNLREVGFLALAGAGLLQLARRNVWPAGITLFWYATTLLAAGDAERGPKT
jgi:hypothetical protein